MMGFAPLNPSYDMRIGRSFLDLDVKRTDDCAPAGDLGGDVIGKACRMPRESGIQ